jgi:hypothetical protein
MKPDRSNYEIWFIDWLDGNLDSHQVELLDLFLNDNPDLKEEFKELEHVIIEHPAGQFQNKASLMKSPADISDSQFEYLCIAYLENDLSSEQRTELMEIVEEDENKKKSFGLIQKTRISPVSLTYNRKSHLLRRTPVQKVIRLSVIGLSAAAAVIFMLTTFLNAPRDISTSISATASIIVPDKIIRKPAEHENERRPAKVIKENITIAKTELTTIITEDSLVKSINDQRIILNRINFTSDITLTDGFNSNNLIASNTIYIVPEEDDGRSNISRFISKTFREKLLKENSPKNSPLKGYEIAEAGVTGLNKLLGWDMSLGENNDLNGELNSVYFSSKLLKFNTPVKKSEPSE